MHAVQPGGAQAICPHELCRPKLLLLLRPILIHSLDSGAGALPQSPLTRPPSRSSLPDLVLAHGASRLLPALGSSHAAQNKLPAEKAVARWSRVPRPGQHSEGQCAHVQAVRMVACVTRTLEQLQQALQARAHTFRAPVCPLKRSPCYFPLLLCLCGRCSTWRHAYADGMLTA